MNFFKSVSERFILRVKVELISGFLEWNQTVPILRNFLSDAIRQVHSSATGSEKNRFSIEGIVDSKIIRALMSNDFTVIYQLSVMI